MQICAYVLQKKVANNRYTYVVSQRSITRGGGGGGAGSMVPNSLVPCPTSSYHYILVAESGAVDETRSQREKLSFSVI